MVMVAALMAVLLGCAALSVDVGRTLLTQFRMQAATDAAALAGVASLPSDPGAATTAAQSYASQNGVANPSVALSPDDSEITVTANQTVPTVFAQVLGAIGMPVTVVSHARAAAPPSCWGGSCTPTYRGYSGSGSPPPAAPSCPEVYVGGTWTCAPAGSSQFGLAPLYVAGPSIQSFYAPGGCAWTSAGCAMDSFDLKTGTQSTGSDRGALALDGPGASQYEHALADGAVTAVQTGGTVNTQTGNMEGPTDVGTSTLCTNDNSQPYVVIPVVTQAPTEGQTTLTVEGFATFAVDCADSGSGYIRGSFVAALLPGEGGTAGGGGNFGLNGRGGLVSG